MKKAFKIVGIILGLLIIALIAAPFIFKGSLEKMLQRTINENLNATVNWEKLDLSIFGSFPDASLQLKNFSVINKVPFQGDTLASGEKLQLEMGIMQLFKSGKQAIKIDAIFLENALINLKIDSLGNANYDVAIKDDAPIIEEDKDSDGGFNFELNNYEIKNSRINYLDASSGIFVTLSEVQHKGKGDLSQLISNLDTKTSALISLEMDKTKYLTNHQLSLDAIFKIDLENQVYSFLENEAKINQLALTFNGFVKINEDNNEVDISFKTPSSDFKNFLALIPEEYVKQIDQVQTTGDFTVNGIIKGIIDEEHIPTLDIKISSNNASFKYPDLPKRVEDITIDAELINETGIVADTYLNIPKLNFRIDSEAFRVNGSVKRITENPLVDMEMQGTLNLANIEKILPVQLDQDLSGIFKADIHAKFDMESVEKERYENIDARGSASLSNFIYKDAGFKNDINISNASINLNPTTITLKELNLTSGKTDIKASGSIQNLIQFLLKKQTLKGRFAVTSNTFNVNDFMTSETSAKEKSDSKSDSSSEVKKESIKIPDFLDATMDFTAKRVLYDNLELKNAKGTATIKDEAISISNFTSDIFGGSLKLEGKVSTIKDTPTFSVNLDLSKIDIEESFEKLEMFKFLVPIADALHGTLNTKFELSGDLTNDLSPKLSTLAGNALAQILTAEVDPNKTPLLQKLGDKIAFLDIDQLGLRNVSTNFKFNNGKIEVKPFDFDVKGIKVNVAGTHALDQTMDYKLNLDIPAKYLGGDINKMLQKLNPQEAEQMKIILPVGLKGTFKDPQISLNTETAITELTQKLIAKQKDKLIDKGTDILGDIIKGATTKDSTKTSTNTNTQQQNTQVVKDVLDGLFKKKKKKTDTTKTSAPNPAP